MVRQRSLSDSSLSMALAAIVCCPEKPLRSSARVVCGAMFVRPASMPSLSRIVEGVTAETAPQQCFYICYERLFSLRINHGGNHITLSNVRLLLLTCGHDIIQALATLASLLGVEEGVLESMLTQRVVKTIGETFTKQLAVPDANLTRDAIVKSLYEVKERLPKAQLPWPSLRCISAACVVHAIPRALIEQPAHLCPLNALRTFLYLGEGCTYRFCCFKVYHPLFARGWSDQVLVHCPFSLFCAAFLMTVRVFLVNRMGIAKIATGQQM